MALVGAVDWKINLLFLGDFNFGAYLLLVFVVRNLDTILFKKKVAETTLSSKSAGEEKTFLG